MSSPSLGQSVESLGSPRYNPTASQYPFPSYDPAQRPSSSARHGARRDSTTAPITSIGGVVDSSTQSRNIPIAEAGNNAISTLLQPPIVRTGLLPHTGGPAAQKAPSAKDIPPVTLTNITHINSKAFQPYLSQAGSLYDAFQRAKEGVNDGGLHGPRKPGASSKSELKGGLSIQASQRRPMSTSGSATVSPLGSPLEPPQPKRRVSGGFPRRGALSITPISTIPNVYFEQDFHLENPRTFDIVSERSEIVRPSSTSSGGMMTPGSSGRKVLATNAILQEKLSWYMDTVEVHLISSISTASTSFFAALGSLRELHMEASNSVAKIQTLRQDLAKLDRDMAVGGLKVVAMRRRRENMRKLGDAVHQLNRIVEAVTRCEEQVDSGDIEDALRGLTGVERLIRGQKDDRPFGEKGSYRYPDENLVDLSGVKALEGAGNDISTLRRRIGKGFESRFLEALLSDLRKHVDTVPSSITFQRWEKASQRFRTNHSRTPSVFPAYLHVDDSLRSSLRSVLGGLSESESVMPATISYREAALREIKTLIKRHLPSSSDDDSESVMSASTQGTRRMTSQDKSTILMRNLRALDAEGSEDLLKKMYSNVGEALRRLGTQVKVVLDVTSSFSNSLPPAGVKSPLSPPIVNMDGYHNNLPPRPSRSFPVQQDEIQQALDMSHLLGQVVDIAQAQITKILKARAEQNTHLSLHRFLRYFHLNRLFADECEAVSGRGGTALKNVVNAHIKEFVAQFAETEKQTLLDGMHADRWDAKDFKPSDSEILDRILEGSTRDVEAWTKACVIWENDDGTVSGTREANGQVTNGDGSLKGLVRSAIIDEQKYILPKSAIMVLHGIERYETLIAGIPGMTQEITTFLLDYLGLFNSRSQQLILGAGATKIAGLKSIITKHLALASQALSFVTALTPHVREFVRRHSAGSGGLMTDFDKMKREYQEHQAGIHDKFVDIMSGRATYNVKLMKNIDWDASPNGGASVNGYMETTVKETTTLHRVLSRHLPNMSVQMIMDPVFESYKEQFGKAIQEVEVRTVSGKESILRDTEYFNSGISKLDGGADLGSYLVRMAREKPVAQQGGSSSDVSESAVSLSVQTSPRAASPEKT